MIMHMHTLPKFCGIGDVCFQVDVGARRERGKVTSLVHVIVTPTSISKPISNRKSSDSDECAPQVQIILIKGEREHRGLVFHFKEGRVRRGGSFRYKRKSRG